MFKYQKVEKRDIDDLFILSIQALHGPYDDFLEEHILSSDFYLMSFDKKSIGFFAISGKVLTQFFLKKEYIYLSQGSFKTILEVFSIQSAFIPTVDELFLSLGMDFHKKVELQAYNFIETDRQVKAAEFPKSMLRLASLSEVDLIKSISGDFFDEVYQMVSDRQIYLFGDEEIYGLGVLVSGQIHTDYKGIGMFTAEEHRRKGVGRSIILHLKDLCHTLGYKPLPGCWYYNHNSKRTLESCGFVSKTRLLKLTF